jgi:prepilin-type N-terminal cleavage/methylation domain-containing protein
MELLYRHKRSQNGFTLVEAILTMVVISFGLLGTMTMFKQTIVDNEGANLTIKTRQLAREKVDEILFDKQSLGWGQIIEANYPAEAIGAFSRATQITEVDPLDLVTAMPNTGYRRIAVSVTGLGQQADITTLATEWGP